MTPQIQHLIGQAIESFQNGNLKQAEEILSRILTTQSNLLPALEILGLIKASQGNHLEAAKLLKKAVKLSPQNPATQYNLAKALSDSKDYVGSLIHHEKALQLAPNNPDGWLNYGQTLAKLMRYERAVIAFDKALSINPHYAEAWHNKGLACSELKQYEETLNCYDRALKLQPNNAKVWVDMSTNFGLIKRYQDAIHCCEKALAIESNLPEAWLNKGCAHGELKDYLAALDCYDKALVLKDDYVDAWFNKGVSLEKLERYQEAIACYNKALALDPTYAKAWLNKGSVLNYRTDYTQALTCFDRAIELHPNYPDAWANKGVSHYELLHLEDSITCCNQAIEIDPGYIDGYWNKSFSELMLGRFEEGWVNYEYRWRRHGADQYLYPNLPALTSLAEVRNKKILVWAEQGFGDTLQFARYIPKLIELGAHVTFEVQGALSSLFQNQYACTLISKGDPIGDIELQTPLLSLPLLFQTNLGSIPSNIPYLQVPPKAIAQWKSKLPLESNKLNIGFACSGNIHFDLKHGNKRPVPLASFSKLAKEHNLFLIQKEIRESDQDTLKTLANIHYLGNLIHNFEDTAAIIQNMDLIISIDTSLAHLAGALGKRMIVLLPWCPDWRWLATGTSNPWYPKATLIRQPHAGDWNPVIEQLEAILAQV